MFENGSLIFASALLDNEERMNGSVMVVNYPSEEELRRKWLDNEVYIVGKVWEDITVRKAKVAKHEK